MACWGCQVTARPYRTQYVKPTRLLDALLLTPDPNQLKLLETTMLERFSFQLANNRGRYTHFIHCDGT
jgi:hypothetical protein